MTTGSKRIAFIDHDLGNFHAKAFLAAIHGPLASRGFRVAGCWAQRPESGGSWAGARDVPYIEDLRELDRRSDCYVILAPSNPETHLPLCEAILPFGKPTYVDKTFAPDLATAKAIFALADRHGAAVQTSSALRYTTVQAEVAKLAPGALRHVVAWGGGTTFGEYAIHPVELVVSCMGADAVAVMRRGSGTYGQILIDFSDGRTAVINVCTEGQTPFTAALTTAEGTTHVTVDDSRLFVDLPAAVLDFFAAGEAAIDRRESLAIRAILDAAAEPSARAAFVPLATRMAVAAR
ncbi:MAG: Gfo/Idh/MocA family oxidoreductase [Planctomycetes bacterium]|nr:Gfo/Idh/MocA family oxidoreductase [Planctomycetota bacterium]